MVRLKLIRVNKRAPGKASNLRAGVLIEIRQAPDTCRMERDSNILNTDLRGFAIFHSEAFYKILKHPQGIAFRCSVNTVFILTPVL